jgi:hypothetical protein
VRMLPADVSEAPCDRWKLRSVSEAETGLAAPFVHVNDETALVVRHYFLHGELNRLPVKPCADGGV